MPFEIILNQSLILLVVNMTLQWILYFLLNLQIHPLLSLKFGSSNFFAIFFVFSSSHSSSIPTVLALATRKYSNNSFATFLDGEFLPFSFSFCFPSCFVSGWFSNDKVLTKEFCTWFFGILQLLKTSSSTCSILRQSIDSRTLEIAYSRQIHL